MILNIICQKSELEIAIEEYATIISNEQHNNEYYTMRIIHHQKLCNILNTNKYNFAPFENYKLANEISYKNAVKIIKHTIKKFNLNKNKKKII
jgi:hypothetical protein